jgi:hypothetical protein
VLDDQLLYKLEKVVAKRTETDGSRTILYSATDENKETGQITFRETFENEYQIYFKFGSVNIALNVTKKL